MEIVKQKNNYKVKIHIKEDRFLSNGRKFLNRQPHEVRKRNFYHIRQALVQLAILFFFPPLGKFELAGLGS
jgi:hypothetical protein